jgi:hypothetical protein
LTQEAIALARRKGSKAGISQHTTRDLDLDGRPEPEAVQAVMLRWHFSLIAVLKTGQQMFECPLELTTGDIKESE